MKKLLVLSVLLGLLALPMFAEHVSVDFGGDDTFGFIGDFGDNHAEKLDLTWDVKVGIDDYNSFTWSTAGLATGGFTALDKALVTTDLGKWLGLPVGFKVMWGYDDPDANEFGDVTGYGNQAYDFSPGEYWGLGFMFSWNFLELEAAFNPGTESPFPATLTQETYDLGKLLIGVAAKEPIPGLNAEVYWFQGGNDAEAYGADEAIDLVVVVDDDPTLVTDFDRGQLGIGVSYDTAFGDFTVKPGVSFLYDMDDAAAAAWTYGFGVAAGYSMFDVTLGVMGMEGSEFDSMNATVVAAPIEKADIYAGLLLSFADGADAFQGADLGVNLHVGAVEIYLGYLVTSNGAGDYNAPEVLTDGGAYIKFDVDY
jgi:hypothetical protein